MNITLLVIGKTDAAYLKEGLNIYVKRLKHYVNFEIVVIPDIKKFKSIENQKKREGELILLKKSGGKEIHLFDEKGKTFSSVGFAGFLEKKMASGLKELVFVIGGPYGFSDEVYKNASSKISLSQLTFSHQMVRLFLLFLSGVAQI